MASAASHSQQVSEEAANGRQLGAAKMRAERRLDLARPPWSMMTTTLQLQRYSYMYTYSAYANLFYNNNDNNNLANSNIDPLQPLLGGI